MANEEDRRSEASSGADAERSTIVDTPSGTPSDTRSIDAEAQNPAPAPPVQDELDYVPDGGREAWLVVMGSSLALFASAGMINAYVCADVVKLYAGDVCANIVS